MYFSARPRQFSLSQLTCRVRSARKGSAPGLLFARAGSLNCWGGCAMPNFICTTCGTQYADTPEPPAACPVCEDPRQYVKASGQQWTTHDRLRRSHKNTLRAEEPGLISLGIEPHFAIGQRTFFLRTKGGNVLWDCLPLLDDALAEAIRAMGGVSGIAISHPHFYSSMVEWSRLLGNVPIYLHASDRQWVMRPEPAIVLWDGETKVLAEGLTLVRCGGHFEG